MSKDVFVYHLDNELQKLFSLERYDKKYLYDIFKLATRIAFLVSDKKILLPASNYFESDLSFKILNELKELNEVGAIDFISSSHNINELLNKKINQHCENIQLPNYHYSDFLDDKKEIVLPATLKKREHSASSDIKKGWIYSLDNSNIKYKLAEFTKDSISASKFEDILYEVPKNLGKRAYISDYVLPLLPIKNEKLKNADYLLNVFITKEYINSFLKEYDAICLKDIPIIDSKIVLPQNDIGHQFVSYNTIATHLKMLKYKDKNALDFVKECNGYQLIEFKNSNLWKSIKEMIESQKQKSTDKSEKNKMIKYDDIKIGIITALPKECAAMKMMMQDVKECFFEKKGAGHRYFLGNLKSANGKMHRVALAECGMGNNKAAIRVTNMLSHFQSINSIIMTGIAGGIPSYSNDDKQIRLGDIVVSTGVIQYDFIKETNEFIENRSNMAKPSAALLESLDIMKVYEYENKNPWHKYIDDFSSNIHFAKPELETDQLYDLENKLIPHPIDNTRTNYPKVFSGKIASANILLKNAAKRQNLKERYGVLAVEMEASGVSDASWNNETGYIVIRGICDYCDSHKNDLWQEYAALVAAAYTRALIENLPSF